MKFAFEPCTVTHCDYNAAHGMYCDRCHGKRCVWCCNILFVNNKRCAWTCDRCRQHFGLRLADFGKECRAMGIQPIPLAIENACREAVMWARSEAGRAAALSYNRFPLAEIERCGEIVLPSRVIVHGQGNADSDIEWDVDDVLDTVEPLPTLREFTPISNLPGSPPPSVYSNVSDPIEFDISAPASQASSPLPMPPITEPLVHIWAEAWETTFDALQAAAADAEVQGGQGGVID